MSSEDRDFDRSIDEQEAELYRRNRAARLRNIAIVALAVLALIFGLVCLFLAKDNERLAASNAAYGQTQQQEKQSLAEEFDAACKSADFAQSAAGSNICRKAAQVASEPGTPPAGPQGERGPRGEQGFPGQTGPAGSPGPAGSNGADGSDGVPGPPGPPGANGTDGADGSPGPPGADSTVPGPAGPPGPQGPQGDTGRGLANAYCGDDGRWLMTYSDGTVADGGVCREPATPIIGGTP